MGRLAKTNSAACPETTHRALRPQLSSRGPRHKQVGSGLHGLLWDPVTAMPAEARRQWRERAIPVAVTAFDGTSADFWLSHWSDAELDRLSVLHVAVDDSGSPAGWVSGRRESWGDRRVSYAASAGVAPHIQGGGLSAALWRRVVMREVIRAFPRPLFVVLRTGNPLVYDAWTAAAGGPEAVHPRPGIPVPPDVQAMARDAAEYLGQAADIDLATLRIDDAYRAVPGGCGVTDPARATRGLTPGSTARSNPPTPSSWSRSSAFWGSPDAP